MKGPFCANAYHFFYSVSEYFMIELNSNNANPLQNIEQKFFGV